MRIPPMQSSVRASSLRPAHSKRGLVRSRRPEPHRVNDGLARERPSWAKWSTVAELGRRPSGVLDLDEIAPAVGLGPVGSLGAAPAGREALDRGWSWASSVLSSFAGVSWLRPGDSVQHEVYDATPSLLCRPGVAPAEMGVGPDDHVERQIGGRDDVVGRGQGAVSKEPDDGFR